MYYSYVLMITSTKINFTCSFVNAATRRLLLTKVVHIVFLLKGAVPEWLPNCALWSWPRLPSMSPGGGNIRYPTPQKGPSRHKLTYFSPIVIVT